MEENKTNNPDNLNSKVPEVGGGEKKVENNIVMGVIAYILFFVPLLTDAKDDPFVKYHVKQGLMVFLIALIAFIISPMIYFVSWLVNLFVLVMVVLGIVNVVNNKKEPLPLIGQYAEKFKF